MATEKALDLAVESAKQLGENERRQLGKEEAIQQSLQLVSDCNVAMLGSIDAAGFPNIKAMMKTETEGLKTVWFSTNTSTQRVAQFQKHPKACVYFVSPESFRGLQLVGTIEVLSDPEAKQRLWREGCEVYYPLGVTDPDYTVLRFTATWGNYYHGLQNVSFEIE